MQEQDETVRKQVVEKSHNETNNETLFVEDRIPEKEPEIEIMRRKWEEQTAKLSHKVDIHYQDVLFDEARTHGVGYYAFSQDEEERAKQQESLFKLRRETEEQQKKNQQICDMKDKMQQNRLRIARLRQKIRAGLSPEEAEAEEIANEAATSANSEMQEKDTGHNIQEIDDNKNNDNHDEKVNKQETAKDKLQEIENKVQAFGKLLEKSNKWYVMSQEEWVQKKRKERTSEFAPVYDNFQYGGYLANKSGTNHKGSNNSDDDSNIIGPMPPTEDNVDIIGPVSPSQDFLDNIGPTPLSQDQSTNMGSVAAPETNILQKSKGL